MREVLGAVQPELWLLAETSLQHIVAALDHVAPTLVVVDSIQTVADPALGSAPGSVAQGSGTSVAARNLRAGLEARMEILTGGATAGAVGALR